MEYNYNIEILDGDFMLNGEELFITYRVTTYGIELSAYYKGDNRKINYIDEFDDYHDEFELKHDLANRFIDYLKTIKGGS